MRPCVITLPNKALRDPARTVRAVFHGFTTVTGKVSTRYRYHKESVVPPTECCAVVELENGAVGLVELERVRFLNTEVVMTQFDWSGENLTKEDKTND